jgi:hypothetical protein
VTAISVIVPARDAAATIADTLDGLAAQHDAPAHEVIVVDNGSHDATATIAERHPLGPRVLHRARGGGPGLARDDGVRAATADRLAFTDADCRPAPGWLAAGARALDGADLVQGRVVPDPRAPRARFDRTVSIERETGLYETANLFLRRETWAAAEGFGPGLERDGRPFGEDTRLGWRARRAGARTAFCAAALVQHAVFPGTYGDLLAERRRLRWFPGLVAELPELRDGVLHRRVFLSPRTAAFDLAAAGAAVAAAARSPLPLLAALPYARRLRREAGSDPAYAAALAAADALGALSLARGSLEARTPLL